MLRLLLLAAVLCLAAPAPSAVAQTASETAALAAMSDQSLAKMPAKKVFGGQKLPRSR